MTAEGERLAELLEELRGQGEAPSRPIPPFGGLAGELVYSFLAWEAGQQRASRAARSLGSQVVDLNELRVCLPADMRPMFGPRYPMGMERARRIRSALRAIFDRDDSLSLAGLTQLPAPDAYQSLLETEGVTPFVAARVVLLGLGCPAMPIDGRIARALRRIEALPADVRNDDAGQWAQDHLGELDLADAYLRLDRWADDAGGVGGEGEGA